MTPACILTTIPRVAAEAKRGLLVRTALATACGLLADRRSSGLPHPPSASKRTTRVGPLNRPGTSRDTSGFALGL